MSRPLKILHIASEMSPLIATGGLADVANALPQALHGLGHDVRVAIPAYASIPQEHLGEPLGLASARLDGKEVQGALRRGTLPGSDLPVYLLEHVGYFGREHPYGHRASEYGDNAERFCFFSQAILDGIGRTGWHPDIVHCHDWHTAAAIAFIKTRFAETPPWRDAVCVFTIHNLAYQGRYPAAQFGYTGLDAGLFTPSFAEYFGGLNLMKLGITLADKLTTVSPRYAREIQTSEYGEGLDGVLRMRGADLHGILNGIDRAAWSPGADPHIAASFDADCLDGKAVCKRALQERLGLEVSEAPLFGVVSRLFWQKGIDLITDALEEILALKVQLAVLGTGEPAIENVLLAAAQRHPERIGVALKFDLGLAHQIQAGSDFFLMPSRYEPCGLTQMYSLAYGSVPVVRRTGGLADTVRDANPVHLRRGEANGFTFVPATPAALVRTMRRAVDAYQQPELLGALRHRGMREDFSWARSAEAYAALYRGAIKERHARRAANA